MTLLVAMHESDPDTETLRSEDPGQIARFLGDRGIRFEQWWATVELAPAARESDVLAAYRGDVDRLMGECGYRSVDVVRLAPDPSDPDGYRQKAASARAKFLQEHTHGEDEVRFFVEGSGLFYLHLGGEVLCVLCERGDLLSVPAKTTHWFDMGTEPHFAAIRLFTNPDGWVASFTGSTISERFPTYDQLAATRGRA